MHACAIGALKIVKVDHRHFGIRVAANRASCNVNVEDGILAEIEGFPGVPVSGYPRKSESQFTFFVEPFDRVTGSVSYPAITA